MLPDDGRRQQLLKLHEGKPSVAAIRVPLLHQDDVEPTRSRTCVPVAFRASTSLTVDNLNGVTIKRDVKIRYKNDKRATDGSVAIALMSCRGQLDLVDCRVDWCRL